MRNLRFRARQLILTLAAFSCPAALLAADGSSDERSGTRSPWSPFARGGYVHQFDSDLDGGGKFDVDRFFLQGGMSFSMGPRRRISVSVGAGRDRYDFSGKLGSVDEPWNRIDQLRFSVPATWAVDEQWTLFAIPTLRFCVEFGADSLELRPGGSLRVAALYPQAEVLYEGQVGPDTQWTSKLKRRRSGVTDVQTLITVVLNAHNGKLHSFASGVGRPT